MGVSPKIYTFRCVKCKLKKISLMYELPDEWVALSGIKEKSIVACSTACLFSELSNNYFCLEQMALAITGRVNGNGKRKNQKSKVV